jgi:protein O-mannosyl-transferase
VRIRWLAPLLLFIAAFGVYAPTIGYQFVWDDQYVVADARHIGETAGPVGFLAAEYRPNPVPTGFYRPLAQLSLWLNGFFPGGAAPFHLVNVLLHAAAALLLFGVMLSAGISSRGAFWGSLFFALTPLHSETVSFVSGRTDLFAGVFVLIAAWMWLRGREKPSPSAWTLLVGSGALFLAVLSKENAAVLPFALLAWEALDPGLHSHQQRPGWFMRTRWWLLAWGLALAAAFALRFGVAGVGVGLAGQETTPAQISPLLAVLHHLRLLVFPWPLSVLYTPEQITLSVISLIGAALVLALLFFLAAPSRRRLGLVALAWIALFLLPVSGIVSLGSARVAERFLYLPSFGFFLAVGYGIALLPLSGRRRIVAAAAAISLASVLAVGTLVRERVWRDELALFADAVQTAPASSLARGNLGRALLQRERLPEALVQFRRALDLDPANRPALTNLTLALIMMGKVGEAGEDNLKALAQGGGDPERVVQVGKALLQASHAKEAESLMLRALLLRDSPLFHLLLADALRIQGHKEQALTHYRSALRLDPGNGGAREALRYYYGMANP